MISKLYQSADNLGQCLERAFPDSHIILSGLPTYGNKGKNTLKQNLEAYLTHKLAKNFKICLMDNSGFNLTDPLHLSLRIKEGICTRLAKLAYPNQL